MSNESDALREAAAKVGVGGYRRHILLCTGPSCCTPETGQAAWDALKNEIKAQNLASGPNACYRSKVGCLRICCYGPTAVVYPEGTWYHGLTADRIPRVVQEHLRDGRPISDWIFAAQSDRSGRSLK